MTKIEKKTCYLCDVEKEITKFEADKRVGGGRTNRCYECKRESEGRAGMLLQRLRVRAERDGTSVDVTKKELEEMYGFFNGLCAYCLTNEKDSGDTFHTDHVVPTSLGGGHSACNIVLTCPTCNQKKHAKPLLVFFDEQGDAFNDYALLAIFHYMAIKRGVPMKEIKAEQLAHKVHYLLKKTTEHKFEYNDILQDLRDELKEESV